MNPLVDYAGFKAAVTNEDLRLLTLAAHKQLIRPVTNEEADAVKLGLTRLLTYKLLNEGREVWTWEGDVLVRQFDCLINPMAVAYMTQLTMDGLAALHSQNTQPA